MKVIGSKTKTKKYALQKVIGQGSFGKVYHSPPYAVKQITLNVQSYLKNAFKNEIEILKKLDHPNIVKLYDILEEGGYLYMVMEYCDMDLSAYLKKNRLDQKRAVMIFKQIMTGLQQLVDRGIIHRDLKPANILVNSRNEFKLADFGLAKHVKQYDNEMLQTIAGTPLYMAPQLLKKTAYTTKCDVWSSGVIFYELLTGRLPWTASNERELYQNIMSKPLQIPVDLSPWSKDLLKRMLVVDENARISWDQIFRITNKDQGLAFSDKNQRNRSKDHRSNSENRPTSKCKLESPKERSLEKIPKHQPEIIMGYELSKIKLLIELDLTEYFGEERATKVVKYPNEKLSSNEQSKLIEILGLYCPKVESYFKSQFKLP